MIFQKLRYKKKKAEEREKKPSWFKLELLLKKFNEAEIKELQK